MEIKLIPPSRLTASEKRQILQIQKEQEIRSFAVKTLLDTTSNLSAILPDRQYAERLIDAFFEGNKSLLREFNNRAEKNEWSAELHGFETALMFAIEHVGIDEARALIQGRLSFKDSQRTKNINELLRSIS